MYKYTYRLREYNVPIYVYTDSIDLLYV